MTDKKEKTGDEPVGISALQYFGYIEFHCAACGNRLDLASRRIDGREKWRFDDSKSKILVIPCRTCMDTPRQFADAAADAVYESFRKFKENSFDTPAENGKINSITLNRVKKNPKEKS
jgi:hypothetical protein